MSEELGRDIDALQAALIDVYDNRPWYEIVANTGLSEERCREIVDVAESALRDYNRRHGLA